MSIRTPRAGRKLLITIAILSLCSTLTFARQWAVLGPDGGDVRSLSYDPHNPDRLFLGTATGTIFLSTDDGHHWSRFAHLGGDDYVLDHIAVNPQDSNVIYVAAWSVENQQAGDLFRTRDGGKTWETLPGMHDKSIRALSMAASDANVLVVGALDGVYRSNDGGNSWSRITTAQGEIKNIESIAVDPKDPNVVYAGTWHLAWKTSDGGATWSHINKGMIDDSDVFSIIVDGSNPAVVFASACSGIYRSDNSGELFHKIQGIPFSARRTRVLKQDPSDPNTVYAGTTEGLWKTSDSGKFWKRVSDSEVVVNDVLVDPRNSRRVLLATDRSGVMASDDGAQTFSASNHGYSHRYVSSIVVDGKDPNTVEVGVVNDREWGGVFASHDGGQHWTQESTGLGGRDVFALAEAPGGTLIAGTNRGVFLLQAESTAWRPSSAVVNVKTKVRTVIRGKKRVPVTSKIVTRGVLDGRVSDLQVESGRWLAATSNGLYISTNDGKSWSGGPVLGKNELVSVQSKGDLVVAATRLYVLVSRDGGETWQEASLAPYVNSIRGVAIAPDGEILAASREGAFRSSDNGVTWEHLINGIADKNISSIGYDQKGGRLLATSLATGVVFESRDSGRSWKRGPDAGYPLRCLSIAHGRLLAATPFDGVIAQPQDDAESASAAMSGSSN
ncbi:MAG TPA: YCF48-related protein [Terriglobales bacterium]|nr:YCF48-related protein [Terriglobales bacterium]